MAFGTKNKRDWNAQDNATHAVATMLGAEMKQKREKLEARAKVAIAMGAGFALAVVYLVLDACF